MKKIFAVILMAALPGLALAAGGNVHLDKAPVNLNDTASLQRGAQLFTNYCLSCHSAAYSRYNRVGKDLGLTDEQVQENLLFAGEKIGETMKIAMPAGDAKKWFGTTPPDLSVIARARGADWLYTYMRGFYADETRPFGVNNTVFPDVGMPHVLWELQGVRKPIIRTVTDADGNQAHETTGYESVVPGTMSEFEYDQASGDLVNFLVYLAEPVQLERQRLGWGVLLFLGVFLVFAYALKKEYWKDIH